MTNHGSESSKIDDCGNRGLVNARGGLQEDLTRLFRLWTVGGVSEEGKDCSCARANVDRISTAGLIRSRGN